jgi:hypothetical protein
MDAALRWPSLQIRGDLRKLPLINSVVKIKVMRQSEISDKSGVKIAAMRQFWREVGRFERYFVRDVKK